MKVKAVLLSPQKHVSSPLGPPSTPKTNVRCGIAEISEVRQAEDFAEVLDEKLKFPSQWALWEHYDTSDYQKSMRKVAWFDDVISFSEAW